MMLDDHKNLSSIPLLVIMSVLAMGIIIRFASLHASDAILSDSAFLDAQMERVQNHLMSLSLPDALKNDRGLEEFVQTQPDSELNNGNVNPFPHPILSNITLTAQHFDPNARVRLLPGSDEQPGTAGMDDNDNGVIDDAGELGATFSDDVCVVEASHAPAHPTDPGIVLQRGAYVDTHECFTQTTRYPNRLLVLYQGQDKPWSFVLDR